MVADGPCACTQGDLEQGMAIEQAYNGDEEAEWKGVVRCRLMWFVERVRF